MNEAIRHFKRSGLLAISGKECCWHVDFLTKGLFMAQRGKGEGSIRKRPDGTWEARIDIGHDPTGKRRSKSVYGSTKREVTEKLTKLASQKLDGTLIETGRMTVGDLLERWIEDSARVTCEPGTVQEYRRIVDKHLKPRIGDTKLSALKPLHIQSMLATMERAKVGARTRQYALISLHRAFAVGIRWKLVMWNPCDGVDRPKVTRREIVPLSADQASKLLKASEENRQHAVIVLAITTGMRQGELFGLQWEDVDLPRGVLSVKRSLEEINGKMRLKEPKSKSGRRQISLPKMAVQALWEHKAMLLTEGLAGSTYVFPDTEGGPLRKCNFHRNVWVPIRKSVKMENLHIHDLRHASATMMLAEGVHPKVVQERLRHANISMTMDIYSHVMPTMQTEAAGKFDRLLG